MSNGVSINIRTWTNKPDKNMEKIILNCPWDYYAAQKVVEYSRKVLNKRWEEGERIVLKSPYYSYLYARHVIKNKWNEAEENISKDSNAAYLYAKYILKGRFIQAEENKKTFTDAKNIYLYSKYVLKSRWKEKEKYMVNPKKGYFYNTADTLVDYSRHVIKGRWEKAEPFIAKAWISTINRYASFLNPTDLEDFERRLLLETLVESENKWQSNQAKEYFKQKGKIV
jgi:hypothetical protein